MFIIATVHKNPLELSKVEEMLDAAVDILRVKFAHISDAEILDTIRQLKNLISKKKANTKILADLPENKIRLGKIKKITENICKDQRFTVKNSSFSTSIANHIPLILNDNFSKYFFTGDKIFIGDGELSFIVEKVISADKMKIRFLNSGILGQYRSLMSSQLMDSLDHKKAALSRLYLLKNIFPKYIALSFVNSKTYIEEVKNYLDKLYEGKYKPLILAKIESQDGLDNIEEIPSAADMIVLGRGDLALTTDYKKLILEQKRICDLCKNKGKPLVVATQILESCLNNVIPGRSDLADITNIVIDGADGIWLSKETSANKHPGEVVKIAKDIINIVSSRSMEHKNSQ